MNEEFNDPRLVAIYDHINPWAADNDFYLSLPQTDNCSILDLGCGTGILAAAYAQAGHAVVGVDPSPAMLAFASQRPHGEMVTWVESMAQDYRADQRFDLIIMTGHAFQFLLTDDDIQAALLTFRHHLTHDGHVVFETRNPVVRIWDAWTPERSRQVAEIDGIGTVEAWTQVDIEERDRIGFTMSFHFHNTGETLTSSSWLRLLNQSEVHEHMAQAGLRIDRLYGDWQRAPFTPESREIIVVAKRSPGVND
ncbi:class I SAM-dependent methyltransferase [Candidatus Entotheonella serta]|nr:class I SAM-dependent methyltransferase [Candidatus Entotheonella serta]